jgi:hypothetical protein
MEHRSTTSITSVVVVGRPATRDLTFCSTFWSAGILDMACKPIMLRATEKQAGPGRLQLLFREQYNIMTLTYSTDPVTYCGFCAARTVVDTLYDCGLQTAHRWIKTSIVQMRNNIFKPERDQAFSEQRDQSLMNFGALKVSTKILQAGYLRLWQRCSFLIYMDVHFLNRHTNKTRPGGDSMFASYIDNGKPSKLLDQS